MSDFPSGAICVVGLAKVANQNPIHSVHRALAGSFIVDPSSGLVYDVQFDTVCQITSDFLASLLIGLSLHTDLEEMISRVQSRYFGDSRRDSDGSSGGNYANNSYGGNNGGYSAPAGGYAAPVGGSGFSEIDEEDGDLPF